MPDTDRDGIAPEALQKVLVAARDAGFLGPGPVERHLRHAQGFVALARMEAEGQSPRLLDLGSGGGLPGLVVAGAWPEATMVLLEANERRAQFLERAVVACSLQQRVSVVHQRAEIFGRDPLYRAAFDGVVARRSERRLWWRSALPRSSGLVAGSLSRSLRARTASRMQG